MSEVKSADREALEAQVKALKELIEVARAVVSTLDLDTVLQAILTSAMHFAETPAGSVALYDEKKHDLSLHAHSGLTADFVKQERWDVTPGGLTDQVLNARKIYFVEDTDNVQFSQNPMMIKEGIRSLVCVPLILRDRIVGILYLDDYVPRIFDKEKMNLLSVLSSFAAMAIYNAKLHNKTKILAITDALTGLHNHRHFHKIFNTESAGRNATRRTCQSSCLMLTILRSLMTSSDIPLVTMYWLVSVRSSPAR